MIWKSVAFLCRYGNQSADVCLAMPLRDLRDLSSAVSEIMREEADAMKDAAHG